MNEKYEPIMEKSLPEQIDDLLKCSDFDTIANLPGIELVDDRKNWMEGEGHFTCTSHVFGKGKYVVWEREGEKYLQPKGYVETQSPQQGDIVFYFRDGSPAHVGIYAGDDRVESKFGIAHVYRHPVAAVPTFYGKPRFFRKSGDSVD